MQFNMKVRFVNFGLQYQKQKKEIDKAVKYCIDNGKFVLQDEVEKFEQEFADYVGAKYCVGMNSGTDALYLALWHAGVRPGDEVIVPSHTFVATAQVVAQLKATPVLVDMDGKFTLTERTKAVIVAHIAGDIAIEMRPLIKLAAKWGIPVIEDACQSLGAEQHGIKAGAWGDMGCFSFYPAKILGCFGDGGALVTDDKETYERMRELRHHYKYTNKEWGINSRLDNIQAAVLSVKLKRLPEMLKRRKEIADMYLKELEGVVGLPINRPGRVWQDFVIMVGSKRDDLFEWLKKEGVETMKNDYPFPITKGPLSVVYEQATLRIPCNDVLTDAEIKYVIKKIKEFFGK